MFKKLLISLLCLTLGFNGIQANNLEKAEQEARAALHQEFNTDVLEMAKQSLEIAKKALEEAKAQAAQKSQEANQAADKVQSESTAAYAKLQLEEQAAFDKVKNMTAIVDNAKKAFVTLTGEQKAKEAISLVAKVKTFAQNQNKAFNKFLHSKDGKDSEKINALKAAAVATPLVGALVGGAYLVYKNRRAKQARVVVVQDQNDNEVFLIDFEDEEQI